MTTHNEEFSTRQTGKHLLILGIAEGVSGLGSWVTMLALFSLVVFRSGGGLFETGGMMLAMLVPMLIFSPVAGYLADKFDRRSMMIASQLLSIIPVLGLITLSSNTAWVYPLLALQATLSTLTSPARRAAMPRLVGKKALSKANAILQQVASGCKIAGPFLGGLLVSLMGPQTAMIFDAVSYLIAGLLLFTLPRLPQLVEKTTADHNPDNVQERQPGLLEIISDARIAWSFTVIFLFVVVLTGFDIVLPTFTKLHLVGGEKSFGSLIAIVGIGSLVSSVWIWRRKEEGEPWRDVSSGLLLVFAYLVMQSLAAWMRNPLAATIVTFMGSIVLGLGAGVINIQLTTLLQTIAPDRLLGRVMGFLQGMIVSGQLIAILGVPLVLRDASGIGLYFAALTGVMGLITLVWVRLAQTGRRPEEDSARLATEAGAL